MLAKFRRPCFGPGRAAVNFQTNAPFHCYFIYNKLPAPVSQALERAAGSVHHEILFTEQEGIDAIPDVVYQLETFDITTIRWDASWAKMADPSGRAVKSVHKDSL